MKVQILAPAAVIALMLTGCTGGTGDAGPGDGGPSTAPSAQPGGSEGSGVTAENCGGLTTELLQNIFGVDLAGPEQERGSNDHNGVTWTDTGCDWENDAVDLELDLDIAVASDFADGAVGCFEPGGVGDVTPVEGIGNQAWWKFGDLNEAEGTLRVCTDDALVDFEIDAETGSSTSDQLRDKALEAVRAVVGG